MSPGPGLTHPFTYTTHILFVTVVGLTPRGRLRFPSLYWPKEALILLAIRGGPVDSWLDPSDS